MRTLYRKLPRAGGATHSGALTWQDHMMWVAAGGLLAASVAVLFAGVLQLPRTIYLVFYIGIMGSFLAAYAQAGAIDLRRVLAANWPWGLLAGAVAAFLVVQATLQQPAPRSSTPQGATLVFDLLWLGLAYGLVDGLLLSVLPVYATWQALTQRGWTERWLGRIAAAALALVASALVVGVYHLGYPEFRGSQVLIIMVSVAGQSLFYLLSRSPLAPLISHVAMHVTAVLVGLETFSQLPPHY